MFQIPKKKRFLKARFVIVINIIAIVVAVVVSGLVFTWYQNKNYERIVSQNEAYISDNAKQIALKVESKFVDSQVMAKNSAANYVNFKNQNSELSIEEILQFVYEETIFDRVSIIDKDGTDFSLEGTAKIADREYVIAGLKGESTIEYIEESRVTGEPTIIFATPIIDDGEIIGVFAGHYNESNLEVFLEEYLFDVQTDIHLILEDGTVMGSSSGADDYTNLFNHLDTIRFSGAISTDEIKDMIEDDSITDISFRYKESSGTVVGTLTKFSVGGTNLLIWVTVPSEVTESMLANANYAGVVLEGVLAGVFLLLLILLTIITFSQNKILTNSVKEATKDLLEKNEELIKAEALAKESFETATRANKAKTNFLANMSHDIRTPMNAIIGMTAIAASNIDDNEKVADCLNKITTSGKHLLDLINEVLDMSKIESGRIDLHVEKINLAELIDNIIIMVRPLMDNMKHNFKVNVNSITHEYVIGDSQRIQRVFMNLLSNAVKYTPKGGEINFRITEKQTNKKNVACYEFVVEDNGIGMSEDYLEQVFEPFTRADDKKALEQQGTGLGMAITKNIVSMMNGDITVQSELDKGSRFTVNLFLQIPEHTDIIDEEIRGLEVLVVDDDIYACENAKSILQDMGMKCESVHSGEKAVEIISQRVEEGRNFYAAIVDWKMPGMNGLETVKEIKKITNDENFHIFFASLYDFSEIEHEATEVGVDVFIAKPYFKSHFQHVFRQIRGEEINNSKAGDELEGLEELDFSGKRCLLVEDNEINAEIASEVLEMTSIEIERAEDGKEAVNMVAGNPDGYYDIIFMDIQMPVMDGLCATKEIRAMSRDYAKNVPIIAMSANAFAEDAEAAKKAGMNNHIPKPIDFDLLAKVMSEYLR